MQRCRKHDQHSSIYKPQYKAIGINSLETTVYMMLAFCQIYRCFCVEWHCTGQHCILNQQKINHDIHHLKYGLSSKYLKCFEIAKQDVKRIKFTTITVITVILPILFLDHQKFQKFWLVCLYFLTFWTYLNETTMFPPIIVMINAQLIQSTTASNAISFNTDTWKYPKEYHCYKTMQSCQAQFQAN